jgi:hypothetical protein
MQCLGTTDFDNNSRLITLSAIIISGLHCIAKLYASSDVVTLIYIIRPRFALPCLVQIASQQTLPEHTFC